MSDKETEISPTINLRDYFASAAMSGMLADSDSTLSLDKIVATAYIIADKMLKERGE